MKDQARRVLLHYAELAEKAWEGSKGSPNERLVYFGQAQAYLSAIAVIDAFDSAEAKAENPGSLGTRSEPVGPKPVEGGMADEAAQARCSHSRIVWSEEASKKCWCPECGAWLQRKT